MKLILVTGTSGSGKTSFIQKEYGGNEKFFIFDMATQSQKLFGNYEAINDGNLIADIYNSLSEEALDALFEGLDIVVEYCIDGNDSELQEVIKDARSVGIHTELILIDRDPSQTEKRNENFKVSTFPSSKIKDETIEILLGVLESYQLNLGFEEICEIGGKELSISFFKMEKENKDSFFYTEDLKGHFDFEPQFEFEKLSQVNYLKEFDSFQEAFDSLLENHLIFDLVPLKVNPAYKNKFRKLFQKQINHYNNQPQHRNWVQFLN